MSFKEKREKFLNTLSNLIKNGKKEEWKEPDEKSMYYYKNMRLPGIYLNDIANEETVKYLGENKYSFNTENLNLQNNYSLMRTLIERNVDMLSCITEGTQKRSEYEEFSTRVNHKLTLSSFYQTKENNLQKAFDILEKFFPETIAFYNSVMKEDNQIEEH